MIEPRSRRRGIPLRAVTPNAVTALALCFGLTGVRFAITEEWDKAVGAIVIAGVLDGLDGRIARLLKAQSRFGAELDSLSDVIAFGVSPAVILFLWSLHYVPKYGWVIALAHAVCCALRLARFNATLDAGDNPRKAAGYFNGVPAPAGAALALLPLILWLATDQWPILQLTYVVAPWTIIVALLMISDLPTYGWGSFRVRRGVRLPLLLLVGLAGASLLTAPWATLSGLVLIYVVAIPLAIRSYARVKRQRVSLNFPS
ncbi:CDP-alcohol phosphatidyltransferase family protein [Sphingomonas nostoxanthinifaciens]|uniref:CDP-alcohol phosphatidyltransferase family protein n=1 Tax=Sphingomonas nostoxanthinifaciens TaxID=2872652 RepID=UPI001CC1E63A|nr:phosphatidylcholine/phosphatidylserine synthase [Sphingomonas nostoxanthinifaciens]UAK25340.1 phosphatidylcholine/phosphatidylserine synthase [Sphingomonas nostoxanthinifaciens]